MMCEPCYKTGNELYKDIAIAKSESAIKLWILGGEGVTLKPIVARELGIALIDATREVEQ